MTQTLRKWRNRKLPSILQMSHRAERTRVWLSTVWVCPRVVRQKDFWCQEKEQVQFLAAPNKNQTVLSYQHSSRQTVHMPDAVMKPAPSSNPPTLIPLQREGGHKSNSSNLLPFSQSVVPFCVDGRIRRSETHIQCWRKCECVFSLSVVIPLQTRRQGSEPNIHYRVSKVLFTGQRSPRFSPDSAGAFRQRRSVRAENCILSVYGKLWRFHPHVIGAEWDNTVRHLYTSSPINAS